jgi:uncharacterized glyoxalase superfamily protein PhnB
MVNPIPDGYHTITPYLIADDPRKLLEFTQAAFGAEVGECMDAEDGNIRHAQVQIGTSKLMMGGAQGPSKATSTMLYLYVENCDAVYAQALAAGATSEREPTTEFYGDRTAGVRGPCGNLWWIATHVEDVSPEEMARRAQSQHGG